MPNKAVRNVDVEPFGQLLCFNAVFGTARTLAKNSLVTTLMDGTVANLALVALIAKTPEKFRTERAKRRRLEERLDELVTFDLEDLGLFDGMSTHSDAVEFVFVIIVLDRLRHDD